MNANILKQKFPGVWQTAQQAWSKYRVRKRDARIARITRAFVRQHGWRIMGGPFAGMRYVDTAVCSTLLPKLAGSYEAELHPVLQALSATDYEIVMDVGCAEGYYAVGFAREWPQVQVLAYDTDAQARELCRRMAGENGVAERVRIAEECDANALSALAGKRALLISDCEGCELELLQPTTSPQLRGCDILVELHDCLGLTVRPVICERFAATHDIAIIDTAPRDPAEYPSLKILPAADRVAAVDEIRPPMQWAFMKYRRIFSSPNSEQAAN